ncbi:phosphatase PAP2 family protein [Streptomyces sp. NRRL B-24484]|uniref:phosphatase PAP2 family protein n=1 Tax=Streptomyces sp. NRRL B-24484 TaxID=1463833 RepID=UPI000693FFA4|nr:phosphatase PAP2 family protein [Streptomyces sp. NRRL B-24484]
MTRGDRRPRWPARAALRTADLHLGERLAAATAAFVVASVPAGVLIALIEAEWRPLREFDSGAAERLHTVVLQHPGLLQVLDVLSNGVWDPVTMRLAVAAAVLWLLWRRAWRLAAWSAATEAAAAAVGLATKTAVARVRPHLDAPVAHAPGFSFPSGHTLTATVSCGILLLVTAPLVPRRLRPAVWGAAAVSVFGVGFTRVALGVHWASDVIGGWLIGAALVGATAWAFGAWRRELGLGVPAAVDGLEPELAAPRSDAPTHSRTGH